VPAGLTVRRKKLPCSLGHIAPIGVKRVARQQDLIIIFLLFYGVLCACSHEGECGGSEDGGGAGFAEGVDDVAVSPCGDGAVGGVGDAGEVCEAVEGEYAGCDEGFCCFFEGCPPGCCVLGGEEAGGEIGCWLAYRGRVVALAPCFCWNRQRKWALLSFRNWQSVLLFLMTWISWRECWGQ